MKQANNVWSSEMCLTELDTEKRLLNCTCNLMESMDIVGILDDLSQPASEQKIVFSPISDEIDEPVGIEIVEHEGVAITDLPDFPEVTTKRSEPVKGTSYFFVCVVLFFSLTQVLGSLYLKNLDKIDAKRLEAEVKQGWQKQLIH